MWRTSPRGRRTVSELAALIRSDKASRVALLVGSGVDRALRERETWSAFIERIAREERIDTEAIAPLVRYAESSPVEAAEAVRSMIGAAAFRRRIRHIIASGAVLRPSAVANGLGALIDAGVRVIINLNYTSDVADALSRTSRCSIRIIENSQLPSWNYHQLLSPPERTAHVVHLHGFVDISADPDPEVVLDQRSYNMVTLGSSYYHQFLVRILQDFTLLSIGLSWNDVPLKNAAAEVQFEFPVAAKIHVATFPSEEKHANLWRERGLISSYSVRPIYYNDHKEIPEIIASLVSPQSLQSSTLLATRDLIPIADQLDAWGDYESGPQSDWMATNWRSLFETITSTEIEGLDLTGWLALARIERHLRHFLWFYLPQSERSLERQKLWNRVAELYDQVEELADPIFFTKAALDCRVPEGSEISVDLDSIRGFFEFAIGAFEVQYVGLGESFRTVRGHWVERLRELCHTDAGSRYGRRLALAEKIWTETDTPPSKQFTVDQQNARLAKLRGEAAAADWEAIEAKVALDVVQHGFSDFTRKQSADVPRSWNSSMREHLLGLAEDARNVARTAGCFRREVGAVVLGSFVAPRELAEANLIAIHERIVQRSGRNQELSMLWWIYVGMLAIFCESHPATSENPTTARPWLVQRCGEIRIHSAGELQAITENAVPHWERYHPAAAALAKVIAADLWQHPSRV